MSSLTFASAHQLAQMVRDRYLCRWELLSVPYSNRQTQKISKLNTICTLDEDNARASASGAIDLSQRRENWGALHGVPSIKNIDRWSPNHSGLHSRTTYPNKDATVVAGCGQQERSSRKKQTWQNWRRLSKYKFPFSTLNNPGTDYTPGGSSGAVLPLFTAGLCP